MYHGVINIYKEKGYTSHDVVAKLRGILHMKKIGHTGTLDPDAQGVLPVCLGAATRICEILTEKDKIYQAVLLLGKETDTQDSSGRVLLEVPVKVSEAQVLEAVRHFQGDYWQIPPMYSALKVNGRRLYELAREGNVVERKARLVRLEEITILKMELPRVQIQVRCSKGTYIRTLCHDIGEWLGCKGCMEELVRIQAGSFGIEDAVPLDKVEALVKEGQIKRYIRTIDQVLEVYPFAAVKKEWSHLLYNGNPLFGENLDRGEAFMEEQMIRVYDWMGNFIAVYRYRKEKESFYPVKMFFGGQ